jgi:hypothetical protein
MIWMPYYLCEWSHKVPAFKINTYPHLDIRFNCVRENTRKLNLSDKTTEEGKFRDYVIEFARKLTRKALQHHQQRCETLLADFQQAERPLHEQQTPSFNFHDQHMVALFVVLSQLVIREYNRWVVGQIRNLWCKHIGLVKKEWRLCDARFQRALGLSPAAMDGTEVLCYQIIRQYLTRAGVREIMDARAQGSNSSFPEWDNHSWSGRVIPLFDPREGSPSWLLAAPFARKIQEFEQMIRLLFPPQYGKQACRAFRLTLHRTAQVHVQAILHYTKGTPINEAESASANSQRTRKRRANQSALEKTKWMFPRVRTVDLTAWDDAVKTVADGHGHGMPKHKFDGIASRWRVFVRQDTEPLGSSKALMRDASAAGGWVKAQLTKAQWILAQYDEHKRSREDSMEREEDDDGYPWPPRPSKKATRSRVTESESEDDTYFSDGSDASDASGV